MNWENCNDTYNHMIREVIRRINRFDQILKFIHFANNDDFNPDGKDNLWKIRSLLNWLKCKFSKVFASEINLSMMKSWLGTLLGIAKKS